MRAPFIVLSGLPASGKSTLGRAIAMALRLPMLDKDEILEAFFEGRGIGDADWRRRFSRAADQELIERATELPAAVIASWGAIRTHQQPQVHQAIGSVHFKVSSLKFTASAAQASLHLASLRAPATPGMSMAGKLLKGCWRAS